MTRTEPAALHHHASIDLPRGAGRARGPLAAPGWPVDHHHEPVADPPREPFARQVLLSGQELCAARPPHVQRHPRRHPPGRRLGLALVGEHDHVVERLLLDVSHQREEVFVRFAGEPYDEVGAERHAGHAGPDALHQRARVALGHGPRHRPELVLRDVLERHVHVGHQAPGAGPCLDQPIAPQPRVRVLHSNPADALDGVEGLQQIRELKPARQIAPPCRRVLPDQVQLPHTARGQRARLGEQRLERLGALVAAKPRDDAERAAVVAALADLEIRDVTRRGERPRAVRIERAARGLDADGSLRARAPPGAAGSPLVHEKNVPRGAHHLAPLPRAEHGVHLRELLEQRGARALRQAAGHDDAAEPPAILELAQLAQRGLRLAHSALEERARVDDRDVCAVWAPHRAEAVAHECAQHVLAVHGVLGTAERHERDRGRLRRDGSRAAKGCGPRWCRHARARTRHSNPFC